MTSEICSRFVAACAPAELTALVAAMFDYGLSPFAVDGSSPGRVGGAYTACHSLVQQALQHADSRTQDLLREALPWVLQEGDLADGLILTSAQAASGPPDLSVLGPPDAQSRLFRESPDLWDGLSKDGLLDCTHRDAGELALIHDGTAIHYHQLLRRFFHSSVNRPLIAEVLRIGRLPGNTVQLAVDERRSMPAGDLRDYMEKDHWYGPPLSDRWLDDPYAVGRTVHSCDVEGPGRDYPRFFAYWRMDGDGNKVGQFEELAETPSAALGDLTVVRYLHAIRDIRNGRFVHCDGAVRAYDSEAYAQRRVEQMPTAVAAARYRKLFRLDGEISTSDWSQVVALWFRGNLLVGEYLEGLAQGSVVEPTG